jgi:hypothetical protein
MDKLDSFSQSSSLNHCTDRKIELYVPSYGQIQDEATNFCSEFFRHLFLDASTLVFVRRYFTE